MAYSKQLLEEFDEKNIDTGDLIKVDGREGRLMPKPESGNPDSIVLKLESGYNIGLKPEEIELVEKKDTEEADREKPEYSDEKKDILILHTGGTIASRVSYEEGGVKPAFSPEELVEMYPEAAEHCNIHSEVVAQMLSEDMEPEHWIEIAEKINEVKDDYDGIIVGHGTDTMAFTGSALSLMLKGIDKGVILVGSQRSSDRPSSDAAINIYSACKFLTDTDFTGIGVCMHANSDDDICNVLHGAKVRKMHTSRRDAFKPVNSERIGYVNYEEDEVVKETDTGDTEYVPRFDLNSNVGYLKVRPGMRPEELDFLEEQEYDGVLVEGSGLGHMPVNSFDEKTQHHEEILEKLGELSKKSVVVMASNCINGRVNMNVYDAGYKIQEAGAISSEDMHPTLAYVKLMFILANFDGDFEEHFLEDYSGEMNERTQYAESET